MYLALYIIHFLNKAIIKTHEEIYNHTAEWHHPCQDPDHETEDSNVSCALSGISIASRFAFYFSAPQWPTDGYSIDYTNRYNQRAEYCASRGRL